MHLMPLMLRIESIKPAEAPTSNRAAPVSPSLRSSARCTLETPLQRRLAGTLPDEHRRDEGAQPSSGDLAPLEELRPEASP